MTTSICPQTGFLNTDFKVFSELPFPCEKITKVGDEYGNECEERSAIYKFDNTSWHLNFQEAGTFRVYETTDKDSDYTTVIVKDAIRLGGGSFKDAYIFDDNPWCFVVMHDRTYFHNQVTGEEFMENFSPDEIRAIDKDLVLFCNKADKDCMVYSPAKKEVIANSSNTVYYSPYMLLSEHVDTQKDRKEIVAISLKQNGETSTESLPYEYYKIDIPNAKIDIVFEDAIYVYHLDALKKNARFDLKGKFIKFLDDVFIQYHDGDLSVNSLTNGNTVEVLRFENPLLSVCGIDIRKDQVDCLTKELTESLSNRGEEATIIIENTNVTDIVKVGNYIYTLYKEQSVTIGKHKKTSETLCISSWSKKLPLKLGTWNVRPIINSGLLYLVDNGTTYIINKGNLVYKTEDELHICENAVFFSQKEENGRETIYWIMQSKENSSSITKINGISSNSFHWELLKDYQLIYNKDTCWSITKSFPIIIKWERNTKRISSTSCYGDVKVKSLYFNGIPAVVKGKFVWRTNIPDNLSDITQSNSIGIRVRGGEISLVSFAKNDDGAYREERIFKELFDKTFYNNVLFSDNGNFILYRKNNKNVLMDTESGNENVFESMNFVSHINGYRPMIHLDEYRRPRVIDPLTLNYVDSSQISKFLFLSPDSTMYADTNLSKYIKYFNKITNAYISEKELVEFRNRFNYPFAIDEKEKIVKRKEREVFIRSNEGFYKEENNKILLNIPNFIDSFIESRGYAIIRSTKDDAIIEEIPLKAQLWFLNYVSFSFDGRYVGIAGRFPNGGQYAGLLLVYDLKLHKDVYRNTDSSAVWTIAFTKANDWGAYSSVPVTYTGNADLGIKNEPLVGKSFLTFSADGKYMALSEQGYVPYSSNDESWGHVPSTKVFIRKVKENKSDVCHEINDLSEKGIASTGRAKTIASASFARDNKKIMMAGNDGVVIIRNLELK